MRLQVWLVLALFLGLTATALAEGGEAVAPPPSAAAPAAAEPAGEAAQAEPGAAPTDPKEVEYKRKLAEVEASLHYQTGTVTVGDGRATFNLTPEFRFLDSADAGKVLQAWGNPPDPDVLGLVLPAAVGPFADDGWAVVVTYDEDGHVDDKEADSLDYTAMLKDMKESAEENNAERKKQGYGPVHLIGWAEPPHYDKAAKKLYWAKELDFGNDDHTLNYAVRVLGRKGVLQLNAVASLPQLPMIKATMAKVMPAVVFNAGHRYLDFDPKVDKAAAYGLGALIAGGVAAKAGLFKGLIALLIAGKKLVVLAVAGIGAAVKKFLNKQKTDVG